MPALFLILPLISIFIVNIPGRKAGFKLAFWVALAVCAAYIGLAATSASLAWLRVTSFLNVYLPFSLKLQIDIAGAVVLATIGLVAMVSLFVDKSTKDAHSRNFGNMLLIIMMAMSGVVMTQDIFTMYIFLDVTAVSSFILISLQRERNALEGAFKYLVMSGIATVLILSSVALIFLTVGNVDFESVANYVASTKGMPVQMTVALILLIGGLSIKAGAVPFHAWVPDAYTSAPAPVSVLLAGIVTKITGAYSIIRLVTDVFGGVRIVSIAFMVIGTGSIVVGALAAIGQKDFKRMLAYSSISQVGYIVLAAGLGTPLGFAAALLHFFNHAVFKSLLFVDSNAVEASTGTREMDRLGGLAARMPITAGTSVVGFLSTSGIPPLSGFWSKLLIMIALFRAQEYGFAVIALLSSILTLTYFLIMQKKVFFGKLKDEWSQIKEADALNTVPALVLAGITVLVGVLFPVVLVWMQTRGLI